MEYAFIRMNYYYCCYATPLGFCVCRLCCTGVTFPVKIVKARRRLTAWRVMTSTSCRTGRVPQIVKRVTSGIVTATVCHAPRPVNSVAMRIPACHVKMNSELSPPRTDSNVHFCFYFGNRIRGRALICFTCSLVIPANWFSFNLNLKKKKFSFKKGKQII